jgi:hypothetical protein
VAHGLGDERAVLVVARQRLGLLVVVVLQPVLEPAKKLVRGAQLGGSSRLDEARALDRVQRAARGSRAQRGVAPAAHHLVELRHELDLADAAAAHLDVVGLAAPRGRLEDARVQVAHRIEHPVVEVAAVYEWMHELGDALGLAGDHARLEPRVALPGTRVRDEVILQRPERGDERAAVAKGAQAACPPGKRRRRR